MPRISSAVIVGRKGISLGWRRRFVGVSVATGVLAGVPVATLVGAPVGVVVGVFVRVVVGVSVGVVVGVSVGVVVGVVFGGVAVAVLVAVDAGVLVRVFVGVVVGVRVAVVPPVGVLVGVPLGVGVQGGIWTAPTAEPETGVFAPESVPETWITSMKSVSFGPQAGAVSRALYKQVSPGVPLGCRTVTGDPPTVQGTAVGELPWGVLTTTSPTMALSGSRF